MEYKQGDRILLVDGKYHGGVGIRPGARGTVIADSNESEERINVLFDDYATYRGLSVDDIKKAQTTDDFPYCIEITSKTRF